MPKPFLVFIQKRDPSFETTMDAYLNIRISKFRARKNGNHFSIFEIARNAAIRDFHHNLKREPGVYLMLKV